MKYTVKEIPGVGSYRIFNVNEESTFEDIDEALHQFEQPYYAYCAKGSGPNPDTDLPGWREERDRLVTLWFNSFKKNRNIQLNNFFERIIAFFIKS